MIDSRIVSENIQLVSHVKNVSFAEKYDFAILVGFHGMSESLGILPHSLRFDFKRRTVNNIPIGEVEIYTRWLGFHKIPIILVTGDREATYEANCFNPYRNTCCVKSLFQIENIDKSLLYEKLTLVIESSIKLNKEKCLSNDCDEVSIEFYQPDMADSLKNYTKLDNKIIFKNCTELVEKLYHLIDDINEFNTKNIKKNTEFLKEVRELAKKLTKEALENSKAGDLLKNNNLLFLDENSRNKILETLRMLIIENI